MNTIALQIDYATQELKMHNDLMDAREECERLKNARTYPKPGATRTIQNYDYVFAIMKVKRLEREYAEMFAPEGV